MFHPKLNEDGIPLRLKNPSQGTSPESWNLPEAFAQVVPDGTMPSELGKVPFSAWSDAPTANEAWETLASTMAFDEPIFEPMAGKKSAAGVVLVEPDGRVWAFAPSNAYGAYKATFPKGQADGLSLKATAIKEALEETGLKVELTGFLIDISRTTSFTRFYLARRTGGNPADMGWEAQAVMLMPKHLLATHLTAHTDAPILDHLIKTLG